MQEKFQEWVLLSLFGHKQIAGLLSEAEIGNGSLLRLDVPESEGNPGFTKFVNISSVYSIDPISEDTARRYAARLKVKPIEGWDLSSMVQTRIDEMVSQGRLLKPAQAEVENDNDFFDDDDD